MTITYKTFTLAPAAPDVCQECATKHDPDQPHNADSLYYKYRFYELYGLWPSWADALAHCPPEIRQAWCVELQKHGIFV